jgi:hypothetical protein
MKTLKIVGPLSDSDIAEFVALVRRIDQANPKGVFALTVIDPDAGSMDDSERFIRTLLPPLPDRATAFARASYHDESYPDRTCDGCGKHYRGPAVYCSFECAVADA